MAQAQTVVAVLSGTCTITASPSVTVPPKPLRCRACQRTLAQLANGTVSIERKNAVLSFTFTPETKVQMECHHSIRGLHGGWEPCGAVNLFDMSNLENL